MLIVLFVLFFILIGDKGGTTTKLAAQVVNIKKPNLATSTEILAMYEATDTYRNMHTAFNVYSSQFADLQQDVTLQIGVVRNRSECSFLATMNGSRKY